MSHIQIVKKHKITNLKVVQDRSLNIEIWVKTIQKRKFDDVFKKVIKNVY